MNAAIETPIAGVRILHPAIHRDARGIFSRLADSRDLDADGASDPIVQVNLSVTEKAGATRGMHMQRSPASGWKLVTCLRGRIWDVALDLRRDSPTFRSWHGQFLSPLESMLVPPGCAHGFQVQEGPAEILYLMSEAYQPELELRIHPADASLAIAWPLEIAELSGADKASSPLDRSFPGVAP